MFQKSKCYQLIGVPGSGKTTWINNQNWALSYSIISTDKWVEIFSREVGKTYSQVFATFMPIAIDCMCKEVDIARSMKRNIIWDQTSTTVKSRQKKFNMLPDYEHIAVVFKTPIADELIKRLASRPGKEIPWNVVSEMITKFEPPTEQEGFSQIWRID